MIPLLIIQNNLFHVAKFHEETYTWNLLFFYIVINFIVYQYKYNFKYSIKCEFLFYNFLSSF